MATGQPDWSRANCGFVSGIQVNDPQTFFITRLARTAVAICNDCPISTGCRYYARREGLADGVWGGETAAERRDWWDVNGHPSFTFSDDLDTQILRLRAVGTDDEEEHGTPATYNIGCRCDSCRVAKRLYQRRYKVRRYRPPKDGKPAKHGTTYSASKRGCRCEPCLAALRRETAQARERRARRRAARLATDLKEPADDNGDYASAGQLQAAVNVAGTVTRDFDDNPGTETTGG